MVAQTEQYCNAPKISKHSCKIRNLWNQAVKIMSDQANTVESVGHPLAGRSMSGADTVVQVLADEGVETIFGYSGGAIL